MTDPFLAACAAALPMGVLELIYKKVLHQTFLEHPYITEETRNIIKKSILHKFQSPLYNQLYDEYYFLGTGVVIITYYNNSHKKDIKSIRIQSQKMDVYISMEKQQIVYIQYEPIFWSRVKEPGTLLDENKRKELAKAIVLLHRLYPNLLTRNTPCILNSLPYFKPRTRAVSLYDLFHPKTDKGFNLLPLECLSRCSVM